MASLKNILEKGSGRVGPVIIYQRNGKDYMRSMPEQYRDRKSEKQLRQRQRMKLVHSFLRPFAELIRISYASGAIGRTAFQAAQSYLLKNAIDGEYPDQYINPVKAMLSIGPLSLPREPSVRRTPTGLTFGWKKSDQRNVCNLVIVIYQKSTSTGWHYFTDCRDGDEEYFLAADKFLNKENLDVWIFFHDLRRNVVSNSLYLGEV
jgi:hypothetical protein